MRIGDLLRMPQRSLSMSSLPATQPELALGTSVVRALGVKLGCAEVNKHSGKFDRARR
jgi:hypothetical protein